MVDRNKVFQHFGPRLLEAVVLLIYDEINTLRREQGMPERTFQEFLDSVSNHLSSLPPYDWEDHEP